MTPLAAFPIMTCAGALRGAMSAYVFLRGERVALRAALWMQVAGIAGVLIVAPFVADLKADVLRLLLFGVLLFNVAKLGAAVRRDQALGAGPHEHADDTDADIELSEPLEQFDETEPGHKLDNADERPLTKRRTEHV